MSATTRRMTIVLAGALGIFPQVFEATARGQAVGFQPTIGTAFDGAYLDVLPVVSADRRYVRVSVSAAFSTINGFTPYSVPVVVGGVNGGGHAGGGAAGLGGIGGLGGGGGGGGSGSGHMTFIGPGYAGPGYNAGVGYAGAGYQPLAGPYAMNAGMNPGGQMNFPLAGNAPASGWPGVAPDGAQDFGGAIGAAPGEITNSVRESTMVAKACASAPRLGFAPIGRFPNVRPAKRLRRSSIPP